MRNLVTLSDSIGGNLTGAGFALKPSPTCLAPTVANTSSTRTTSTVWYTRS